MIKTSFVNLNKTVFHLWHLLEYFVTHSSNLRAWFKAQLSITDLVYKPVMCRWHWLVRSHAIKQQYV